MAFMVEPVVLVNPASGTGTEINELEPVFPNCRVEGCSPDEREPRQLGVSSITKAICPELPTLAGPPLGLSMP